MLRMTIQLSGAGGDDCLLSLTGARQSRTTRTSLDLAHTLLIHATTKTLPRVPEGTRQSISATPVVALGQSTPINRASSQVSVPVGSRKKNALDTGRLKVARTMVRGASCTEPSSLGRGWPVSVKNLSVRTRSWPVGG